MRPIVKTRVVLPSGLVKKTDVPQVSAGPDAAPHNSVYLFAINSASVDAYDAELVRSLATAPSDDVTGCGEASTSSYAFTFGGTDGLSYSNSVFAYGTTKSRSTPTDLTGSLRHIAGAAVGVYALAMGGMYYSKEFSAYVNAYNGSLTKSTPANGLSSTRGYAAGVSVGNYALAAGGRTSSSGTGLGVTAVDAYNASLTRSTPTALTESRSQAGAATFNSRAVIAGGYYGTVYSAGRRSSVETYTTSLTKGSISALSVARSTPGLAVAGNTLFVIGGYTGGEDEEIGSSVVDVYDTNFTRTTPAALQLSEAAGRYMAGPIGSYAFAAKSNNTTAFYNNPTAVKSTAIVRR